MATATQRRAERNQAHQVAQASFASSAVASAVAAAWLRLFDRRDVPGSRDRLVVAIRAIVLHYGRASSSAALAHYRNERRAQGVKGPVPRLRPAAPQSVEQIEATVDKVLQPLEAPTVDPVEVEKAVQNAEAALTSEVEQMVLDQSRDTIIDAVHEDREARAWARVTEQGACSFCRLLATRGAVYTSEESADFRAHVKKPNGSGGTCRCHVEPAFGEYEMTAQARQDLADYRDLTKEYGKSGRDLLIAWRQHVEGRPVTGPLTKPYRRSM